MFLALFGYLPWIGSVICAGVPVAYASGRTGESPSPSNCVVIEVNSDVHFSEAEALCQAERCFDEAFLRTVAARTGCRLSKAVLFAQRAKLLYGPNVSRTESTVTIDKPYGTGYRRRIQVSCPQEALQEWVDEVTRQRQHGLRVRVIAVALTPMAWLAGLLALTKMDRCTRGYRRPLIVTAGVVALTCGTWVAWVITLAYT
jgi:hypothetical protein